MVATASRREGVYNRTGEPSVPFCGKGGARERADGVFFASGIKKTSEQSGLCSDVVPAAGVEPARCRHRGILSAMDLKGGSGNYQNIEDKKSTQKPHGINVFLPHRHQNRIVTAFVPISSFSRDLLIF